MMKKQILFLTLMVLAVMAGITESWAQVAGTPGGTSTATDYSSTMYLSGTASCVPATTLPCMSTEANGPLNPLVGQLYDYGVTVTNTLTAGGSGYVRWFVTDDPKLFEAVGQLNTTTVLAGGAGVGVDPGSGTGKYIMTNSDNYNEADAANNADNTLTISWQSWTDDPNKPVLLVAYVVDDAGCTDNIEVYRIQPEFKFTLDIAALKDNGVLWDLDTEVPAECVSPIESAEYKNDGSGNWALEVDYGENWIFFTVNAANFADSWMPTFLLNYTGKYATLQADWAYPNQAASSGGSWNAITPVLDVAGTDTAYWETETPVMKYDITNSTPLGACRTLK